MRVLAIDTALDACAVAVLNTDSTEIVRRTVAMDRGQAEALLPLVAAVVEEAGIDYSQLDRIAVTVGPGSFTGLRIGIAAARGIALATGKPAVGLSTLATYAAPHMAAGETRAVVTVIDARHGQVYLQVFGPGGRTLLGPRIASAAEVVRVAAAGPSVLVGTGAKLVAGAWPRGATVPPIDARPAPDIMWVARLGAAAQPNGALPRPLYLRPPEARPQGSARLPRR